ncbi:hypothetical protein DPSP01_014532 [Paraphaeosphaeria sporulosa]
MHFAYLYGAALLSITASGGPIEKHSYDLDTQLVGNSDRATRDLDGFSPYLPDGFPNPNPEQVKTIQERARGTLPQSPLPIGIGNEGITNFRLIAFNEMFEVAFFSSLIRNITNSISGYDLGDDNGSTIENLETILAVEELHALGANAILAANGIDPVQPCKYIFPVSDYESAIALAATFTNVVLGTLQDVVGISARNSESEVARLISSVIGNEGEQEGLFRLIQQKTTPAQPFLSTSIRDFAFTAIQGFVVPGSCPGIGEIPLKTFQPLNILAKEIQPKTQELQFSISLNDFKADIGSLSLVFMNALNPPIVKAIQNVENNTSDNSVVFTAEFPFEEYQLHGLTISVVTNRAGPFNDISDVADATLFGPGFIEVA